MVAFVAILFSLLLASTSSALPTAKHDNPFSGFPPIPVTAKGLLCGLPIPIVQKLLCPRTGSSNPTVSTPLGTAQGAVGTANVARFAVRYGQAARWHDSTVVTSWELPNDSTDPSQLPLACPQDNIDDSAFSEDCLSMLLYVPSTLSVGSNAPSLLWIHGGSFTSGSATGPGLDGSNLAVATNSIVAVVQYRLGALGLLAPSGKVNLAANDIITALHFLQKVLPSFGGSASKITLAGQSSGANMIRGMLAIPSASSLFQSAILQSDPMDYGFLSSGTQQTLQNYFNGLFSCASSDTACWNSQSIDDILSAQDNLVNAASTLDLSTGVGEPIRLVRDGSLITTPLDSTAPFPSVSKPILVTNVKDEAGVSIYGNVPAITADIYAEVVVGTFGTNETAKILANPNYAALSSPDDVDQRPVLEQLGTDQIWRCPGWTFARNWVGHGGNAFVGLYVVGASYPGNTDVTDFCAEDGVVCHQDDIEIVFGTVPSPNSQQSALVTEMQARYKAFLTTGNPNVAGYATWKVATTTDVHALTLGGTGEVAAGGCDPSFFGDAVLYDYQQFGI
ncbi:Alpha/Beta hydrolase protein [Cytidiella melzeri]|nr:Alpha/Beta hydrolase protein [Cytidiella melzeri]